MPIPNKILPPENLSTREKILRKIHSLEGQPFTLKQINNLTRPRVRIDTVRYHVETLVDELWVERLPREHTTHPQLYIWRDGLAKIRQSVVVGGPARDCLVDLQHIVDRVLAGDIVPQSELNDIYSDTLESLEMVQTELDNLKKLSRCPDLWVVKSLVDRIGFGNPDSH